MNLKELELLGRSITKAVKKLRKQGLEETLDAISVGLEGGEFKLKYVLKDKEDKDEDKNDTQT